MAFTQDTKPNVKNNPPIMAMEMIKFFLFIMGACVSFCVVMLMFVRLSVQVYLKSPYFIPTLYQCFRSPCNALENRVKFLLSGAVHPVSACAAIRGNIIFCALSQVGSHSVHIWQPKPSMCFLSSAGIFSGMGEKEYAFSSGVFL